jgi:hypothetical protein
MRIAVSGSSGLVGSSLVTALHDARQDVAPLVRAAGSGTDGIPWDVVAGPDPGALEGVGAVVHLAGENIADGRWSEARKQRILDSRVEGTRGIAAALARMQTPPGVLVCASAIGFYGDRGEEVLREDSAPGRGFLPEVCQAWEGAADPAREAGIRVVHLRFGIILSAEGGALAKMLLPFRMGLGGKIGSGAQYMSWITLDDVVGSILHALQTEGLEGPVNAVAPEPVTNREFTKALGRVLSRPTLFPLPGFAAGLVFGEMADELLLASTRVDPARLRDTGYTFRHPDLEPALRHLL